jgi:hypothetical protein
MTSRLNKGEKFRRIGGRCLFQGEMVGADHDRAVLGQELARLRTKVAAG